MYSKMAAGRHVGFLKVENFTFRSASDGQCASSCHILRRSVETFRRYGRLSIFNMAAVRHLGFSKVGILTAKVQKFGCNRRSNFDSIQFLIFCALSLKMLFTPQNRGFGGFYPLQKTEMRHHAKFDTMMHVKSLNPTAVIFAFYEQRWQRDTVSKAPNCNISTMF